LHRSKLKCGIRMANGKTCERQKTKISEAACDVHWGLIPMEIKDRVYAGMIEEYNGRKHKKALEECRGLWRERG